MVVVGGVGYRVECSQELQDGDDVELWVETTGSDGLMRLYGFPSPADRDAFVTLTRLPGVGPAAALALLRDVGVGAIAKAAWDKTPATLTVAKGVGAKLAGSIIANLDPSKLPAVTQDSVNGDHYATLVALGYADADVRAALLGVEGDDAEVIAVALDRLNQRSDP